MFNPMTAIVCSYFFIFKERRLYPMAKKKDIENLKYEVSQEIGLKNDIKNKKNRKKSKNDENTSSI